MIERELLMIPGPTNVDPSVLRALAKPTLSHTSSEFVDIFKDTLSNLRKVLITNNEVFITAGSGTLALEIAIANVIESEDKVLNAVSGFFGDYFTRISKAHGATTTVLEVPWGKPITPRIVRKALIASDYKAVTVTHIDTSTGIANPIKEIGEVVREYSDAIFVVDAVCSLGGQEVRVDDWNIDVCVSGSQKCLGAPPGLALLSASKKVLEGLETRRKPVGFWFGDLRNWQPIMRDPSAYFATPPVNMVCAFSEALKLVLKEGLGKRFRRHHILAEMFRDELTKLKIKTVPEKEFAADTLTVAYYPEKVQDSRFRRGMKQRGIVVAPTIGILRGRGFRVGHMGNVNQNDVISTTKALKATLQDLGHPIYTMRD